MTTKQAPAVEYKSESSGGYWRVRRYEDGKQMGSAGSFNSRTIADNLTDELNSAVNAGVALGVRLVADMLDSRFDRDGYGDWQDGWLAAAKEARGYRT
jgi:hypothetical protein